MISDLLGRARPQTATGRCQRRREESKREARVQGKRPETFFFLGFTHYGTYNRKGNYKVGRKTEKSRLLRTLVALRELMRGEQ